MCSMLSQIIEIQRKFICVTSRDYCDIMGNMRLESGNLDINARSLYQYLLMEESLLVGRVGRKNDSVIHEYIKA